MEVKELLDELKAKIEAGELTLEGVNATLAKPLSDDSWKSRSRRTTAELSDLKSQLVDLLRRDKTVSSFQIQAKLGLKDCDWAPACIRRMLAELLEAGEIRKSGEKRGTKYHWTVPEGMPEAKLEKV